MTVSAELSRWWNDPFSVEMFQAALSQIFHFCLFSKGGKNRYLLPAETCLGYYDDETEARELAPLRAIRDSNPKTVVLMDRRGESFTRDGIREIGITDFLLGGE